MPDLTERGFDARVDLSEDSAFLLELLDDTHRWRERLVSELRFGDRNHVRSVSSYQIDFPPALLERAKIPKTARRANVLLPLTTRQKRPLLNFSLSGPGRSPATLTSRLSIAGLQAEFLKLLAETSEARDELAMRVDAQLYESICVFSPGFFQTWFYKKSEDDVAKALSLYLSGSLEWNVSVDDVRRWREKTTEISAILVKYLGEPPDPVSSSEELLLALSKNDPAPQSVKEIDVLVDGFHAGVVAADKASDDRYLTVLAEYGRRYEVVVEVEVPLLEASRIKIEEDLPLKVSRRGVGSWVGPTFPLGDARSAHLEARIDDANVEVADFEVKDLHGVDAKEGLESFRRTREAFTLYGSDPNRPYFVLVWLRLRVARPLMVGAVLLSMANILAIGAVPVIGFESDAGGRLAVLAIPTTVAATFALVREQTALASRLQRIPRLVLALTTLALWLEVVAGLIVVGVGDSAGDSSARPRHRAELVGGNASLGKMAFKEGAKHGEKRSERKRANRSDAGS
jgi:hypothetical protein